MNLTPITLIVIPENRQRREHDPDAHQELRQSIETTQLLHPIVTRVHDGLLYLVAGERRLRAITEIYDFGGTFKHGNVEVPAGMVPYTDLGELSPLEAREAELEENIRRKDLTWQERAKAEAEVLELRKDQARARGDSTLPTASAVVKELRGEDTPALAQSVARNVILANNMHRPEVKGAKSAADAYKALQRADEAARNAELARTLGKEFIGEKHQLVIGDCVDWMRGQPDAQFDVVLSDPPYGMGADEFGDSGGGAAGAHFYEDDADSWHNLMDKLIPELSRVAKPDAHVYLFCDFDKFWMLRKWFENAGWKVFRTPLLWHKPAAFRAPWPEHGPQRKYECILYARRGELKVTKLAPDVLTYPADENLGHPAQKPVALIADLLSRSARPGMKVLDFCCGSGPIFPAAHALSVIAVGVEMDEAAAGIAAKRIQQLKGK